MVRRRACCWSNINPAKNELFTACSGGGSKLNGEPSIAFLKIMKERLWLVAQKLKEECGMPIRKSF
ncbi:MAG: hypothetical protein Ct9H90mP7_0680 [Candidatus Neomarinimicrobiota bacterium]|nr:MAG: hypothetical protein Ct9H90mP7_0680 [Candidatus Neomarinimicrobiota bacterium]